MISFYVGIASGFISQENVYCTESTENQMIIARKEKELVKTIEEVLDGLKCCEKLLCNSCPYDGDENCKSTLIVEARRAIENIIFNNERKSESVTELIKKLNEAYDANRAMKAELKVNLGNPYWANICKMNARQESKGMEKYGEPLEENTTLTTTQRIEHLQEELIDALKYCEHLKVVSNDGITANDYQRACLRTATSDKSEWLENAIYGIIGEAGEIVDLVKKHKWQGHELDREALILEGGDCAWYLSLLMSAVDCTLGEMYEKNIEKLKRRYPEGFSKERSVNRE